MTALLSKRPEVAEEIRALEASLSQIRTAEIDVSAGAPDTTDASGTLSVVQVLAYDRTSFSLNILDANARKLRYRRLLSRIHPRKDGEEPDVALLDVLRRAYRNEDGEVLLSIHLKVMGIGKDDTPEVLRAAIERARGRLIKLQSTLVTPILGNFYGGNRDASAREFVLAMQRMRRRIQSRMLTGHESPPEEAHLQQIKARS